jgi:hypothetical protein
MNLQNEFSILTTRLMLWGHAIGNKLTGFSKRDQMEWVESSTVSTQKNLFEE